jgi:hypothetical protein
MNPAESTSELAVSILTEKSRCPACTEKRLHATADWSHHPYAGHGYQNGQGWSHPDLAHRPQAAGAETSLGIISGEVVQAKTAPVEMAHATSAA